MRYVMSTSRDREPSAQLTVGALAAKVTAKARCSDGTVDPDEWFPVSTEAEAARREAASAIAICMACPVRGACLELSLRHWTIGQHGVWGGLVAADRAALRRQWLAYPDEYGRVLSILDRIWDEPPATSHAGRRDLPRHGGPHLAPCLAQHANNQDGSSAAQPPHSGGVARDQTPPGIRTIPSVGSAVMHVAPALRSR